MAARKRIWARTRTTFDIAAAAQSAINLLTQAQTNLGRTFIDTTVVRVIGRLNVVPDGTVVTTPLKTAWGIMPLAPGVTAPPSPAVASNFNDDWMYWDSLLFPFETYRVASVDAVEANNVPREVTWDIRAQRKLRGQSELRLQIANDSAISLHYGLTVSALLLL